MWDAAIIGGGPAGAAAACLLARAGRSTVLFEREAGPRHKVCGEFISVEAAAYLTALGLDPERLGALPIHHVRLIQGETHRDRRPAVPGVQPVARRDG